MPGYKTILKEALFNSSIKKHRLNILRKNLEVIDSKIEKLKKIKPDSLHVAAMLKRRELLIIRIAKERMFGD